MLSINQKAGFQTGNVPSSVVSVRRETSELSGHQATRTVLANRPYRPITMTNTPDTSVTAPPFNAINNKTRHNLQTITSFPTNVCHVISACSVPGADWAVRMERLARTHSDPGHRKTVFTGSGGRRRFFSLPVRAVRSSRRDAVNADIGFNAQDRLVLALSRHLDSTVIDVGVVVWLWLIYSVLFWREGGFCTCGSVQRFHINPEIGLTTLYCH